MPPDQTHATLEDVSEVFHASDLVGPAGTGHNGQLLVDTLTQVMPADLERILNQRENFELGRGRAGKRGPDGEGLRRKDWEGIAEFAGLDGIKLADVAVRGGADEDGNNVDASEAWISFAYYDDRGDVQKGAIPYLQYTEEADEDDDREPILQVEALASSPAARDHAEAQAKARAAAEAEGSAAGEGGMPNLAEADASAIVRYLEQNPDQVEAVQAFEAASRGDRARKTIMAFEPEEELGLEDAQKRAAELDIEGRSNMNLEQLREAIDQAEGSQGGGGGAPPPDPTT